MSRFEEEKNSQKKSYCLQKEVWEWEDLFSYLREHNEAMFGNIYMLHESQK